MMAEWQTDSLFCAHAGWRLKTSPLQAIGWWQAQISEPDPQLVRLLALDGSDPVGFVDLHGSGHAERELGYVIAPSALWERGLGTAAASAGLVFGFDVLGLTRIWAETVVANIASVRVLRRLGMREIGLGSEEQFLGQNSHYVQFEILATEWRTAVGRIRGEGWMGDQRKVMSPRCEDFLVPHAGLLSLREREEMGFQLT